MSNPTHPPIVVQEVLLLRQGGALDPGRRFRLEQLDRRLQLLAPGAGTAPALEAMLPDLEAKDPSVRALLRDLYPASRERSPAPRPGSLGGEPLRALFLGADPEWAKRLRIDREFQEIQNALAGARERFETTFLPAASAESLLAGLRGARPHLLHFSGHAGDRGLFLDGPDGAEAIDGDAFADLLAEFVDSGLRCVLLNACGTFEQARRIARTIEVAIGMPPGVDDLYAIRFAGAFYRTLCEDPACSFEGAFRPAAKLLALRGCEPRMFRRQPI
ncbi:MAG: hypothetical protein AAGD06_11255 [Acidobacteriota bacterium]